MQNFDKIINVGYRPNQGYQYCIIFAYAKNGNFIIKGDFPRVISELRKYLCVYRLTSWKNGKSRGYWRTNIPGMQIVKDIKNKRVVNKIYYGNAYENFRLFRHIPKKWISFYDEALNNNKVN